MILVTGAAGKTGQAVLKAICARGVSGRGLVRRSDQIPVVIRLGALQAVTGDLLSLEEMARAVEGVRTLYLIAPNMHPEEVRIAEVAIAAAEGAEVERIVYHSVLHPQTRRMPHHWQKLAVEEKLFESGLDYTILQPAAYMQNVLPLWGEIFEDGVYRVPYGEGAALSLVDLADVAEVAATVLTSGDHTGATYELAGQEALTSPQIARVLSRGSGRTVKTESIAVEIWVEEARARGLGEYSLKTLAAMFRYYDRHGLVGNPGVLAWLLGRPPTTFDEFVERTRGHGRHIPESPTQ